MWKELSAQRLDIVQNVQWLHCERVELELVDLVRTFGSLSLPDGPCDLVALFEISKVKHYYYVCARMRGTKLKEMLRSRPMIQEENRSLDIPVDIELAIEYPHKIRVCNWMFSPF
jgi:hypothetical protein